MSLPHYDVLIIGGGQAGVPLAGRLATDERQVGLVERKFLGGTCVNYGCTPTKAVVASARVAHLARRARDYGLRIPHVEVDFPAVIDRARDVLMASRTGIQDRLASSENPRLLRGHARFTGRDGARFHLTIDDESVTADQVVLNVGARTRIPGIDGLDRIDVLHAGNWLDHPTLPDHLLIVGGGYIGLEMGQFYRRMGSRVTIVQGGAQVLPHEDEDVAHTIARLLEAEGVGILLGHRVRAVEPAGDGLRARLEDDEGRTRSLEVSRLFVATGRRPNTDDLGLETIGLATDAAGYVRVDDRLRTSVDGVWAAGDVRGGPMFTHTAWDDHRVVYDQIAGDGARTTDRIVPYGVFTDPELGRVGMTEKAARAAARAAGMSVRTARYEMKQNGKAKELGETDGFVKVVVDAGTDRLLGAAVLAVEGAELVHAYIDLMNADAPYTVIRDAVHIHPTLSEAVQSVFSELAD